MKPALLLLPVALILSGCVTKNSVLSATGTVIGVEIAQNPSTQMYQAKLGYNRAELAIVPTDKTDTSSGANAVADVIMELRYQSMFSLSDAGIYQRLAVGPTAVSQPGAAFMFAKSPDGSLSPTAADAVSKTLKQNIPEPDPAVTTDKLPMAKAFQASTQKPAFDSVAQGLGFQNFGDFLVKPDVSKDTVATMLLRLKTSGLMP